MGARQEVMLDAIVTMHLAPLLPLALGLRCLALSPTNHLPMNAAAGGTSVIETVIAATSATDADHAIGMIFVTDADPVIGVTAAAALWIPAVYAFGISAAEN